MSGSRLKKIVSFITGFAILCGIIFYLDLPAFKGETVASVVSRNIEKGVIPFVGDSDAEIQKILSARKELIVKKCEVYPIARFSRPILQRFLVDDKNKLLYCYIPKVASTNWKKILMVLSGRVNGTELEDIDNENAHKDNHMKTLNDFPSDEIHFRLNNYMKFTFVRHPFERLISAYNNKFLRATNGSFYRLNHGRKIIRKYRKDPSEQALREAHDVRFTEFVQYVIDQWKSGQEMDVHWKPMVDLCSPCHVNYDVIGKFETLKVDADYVLKMVNHNKITKFPDFNPQTTTSLFKSYSAQLSSGQLECVLFFVYKYDFELFGYSSEF